MPAKLLWIACNLLQTFRQANYMCAGHMSPYLTPILQMDILLMNTIECFCGYTKILISFKYIFAHTLRREGSLCLTTSELLDLSYYRPLPAFTAPVKCLLVVLPIHHAIIAPRLHMVFILCPAQDESQQAANGRREVCACVHEFIYVACCLCERSLAYVCEHFSANWT